MLLAPLLLPPVVARRTGTAVFMALFFAGGPRGRTWRERLAWATVFSALVVLYFLIDWLHTRHTG
jgi:hypothetical protein